MTTAPSRLHEIDHLVKDSDHALNPTTMRFERISFEEPDRVTGGAPADQFRSAFLTSVTREELGDYMRWKVAQMDARWAVGGHPLPDDPAEA